MKELSKDEVNELLVENPLIQAEFSCYSKHTFIYNFEVNEVGFAVFCLIDSDSIGKAYLSNKELVCNLMQNDGSYICRRSEL